MEILYSKVIDYLNVLVELSAESNTLFVDMRDEFSELNDICRELEKNLLRLKKIIKIFNEPFNDETFAIACNMIE